MIANPVDLDLEHTLDTHARAEQVSKQHASKMILKTLHSSIERQCSVSRIFQYMQIFWLIGYKSDGLELAQTKPRHACKKNDATILARYDKRVNDVTGRKRTCKGSSDDSHL